MMIQLLYFTTSAFFAISALLVILSKNPIYSALFLILSFFNGSILLIFLEIEYLALVFLIIYVGAVCVLFLFVIMLINLKVILLKQTLNHFLPLFFIFLIINLFTIVFLNSTTGFTIVENHTLYLETTHENKDFIYPTSVLTDESSAASLGSLLFNNFYVELITAGFILLLAMVGTITLALKQNIRQKKQNILYNALK